MTIGARTDLPAKAGAWARPVTSVDDLALDFWPSDEELDEFLVEYRRWRQADI